MDLTKGEKGMCTHQHFANSVSLRQPDYESDEHACDNGDDGFIDDAYAFDLEVVGRPEGEDEQHANEEERP